MFKIITIPFDPFTELFNDETLNDFLANKEVLNYKVCFFQTGPGAAYWTVFLEYETVHGVREVSIKKENENRKSGTPNSKPEKTEIPREDLPLFKILREWRAEKARSEGIPPYIICHNQQLMDIISTKPPVSLEALRIINGFGVKKIQKYGQEILAILKKYHAQEGREEQGEKKDAGE